jgi:hypothetical protein
MPQPFEIVAAPFTGYWAPVGEAFPLIDVAPAGNWVKIGTSGDRNYSGEGVTVALGQTLEPVRPLGSTGPRKMLRIEESMMVRFTLWDSLLEQWRLALNQNAVATTAAGSGTAGFKKLGLYRGLDVEQIALLVRGDVSPYGATWKSQYQVPVCVQSGSPEPVYAKGAPAGLALEFTVLEDPSAATVDERFGNLIVQHATALA